MYIKNEEGITITTLVITIVILIIITSISISSGSESIGEIRLKSFYVKLELIQKRVDEVQSKKEKYEDEDGKEVIISDQGTSYENFEEDDKDELENAFGNVGTEEFFKKFRIFTVEDLEKYLDLTDIGFDVFINFEERCVVARKGLKIDEKTYYMLEKSSYYVDSSNSSNLNVDSSNSSKLKIEFSIPNLEKNKYKADISVKLGTNYVLVYELKYKEASLEDWNKYKEDNTFECWNKYWKQIENNEIIIEEGKIYKVVCIDIKGNKTEKNIKLVIDESSQAKIEEVIE